ncbi:Two component regulator three Y domain-containing protein [Listeria fleischmannii 1991]|uniref:Two component regulator three Y domain-containing protein n=1 Tax=Listeria fleischmannii 1991 TaxID=1430899 RepID=A0A0J8GCZ1_9LIST|nr:Two component regulator three Y domain-containing protein [Listeria fleischmannii]KMT58653.1 Two component regulator three Y domain-containing protein [Listeria fleischmannii 1991]
MKKRCIGLYFKMISRTFKSSTSVQYALKTRRSHDTLVIVFSAFSRVGLPATYNYMATTKEVAADRLFILDDFGYNKQGGYYLFHKGTRAPETVVTELIESIIAQKKYRKVICVGTSKGGYAALYYGLKLKANAVIAGAPQYFLGDYLTDIPEKNPTYKGMVGEKEAYSVPYLNRLLQDKVLEEPKFPIDFYIHYSCNEHTFREHIADLIQDLKASGYPLTLDEQKYYKHQEVAYYFPPFLKRTLKKIIEE